jgi:hypothetical protein
MPSATYIHSPGMAFKLKSIMQVNIVTNNNDPDWLRVSSTALNNKQLFSVLQAAWPAIVGAEPKKYALLHCLSGPSAGVWVHLLPNDEYEPGCHEVQSF